MSSAALDTFRKYLASLDWTDPGFDERKAYACCIWSQFAYRHVRTMELPGTDRLKLIPCGAYEEQLDDGIDYDGHRVLTELELGDGFVIETEQVVALGLVNADKMFIAIRGTAQWYTPRGLKDWSLDLSFWKAPPHSAITGTVHHGFLKATVDFCSKLQKQLIRWSWAGRPIIITGHSLGGAITAVLHTFWRGLVPEATTNRMLPTCAYTFGMPRFGNAEAVGCTAALYHVYHPGDVVPTLPPVGRYFADADFDYALLDDGLEQTLKYKGQFKGVEQHYIASYRRNFESDSAIKRRIILDQA